MEAQASRRRLVEIHQTTLACTLRVNNSTVSAAIRDLREAGKIRKISSRRGNIGVYLVREPEALSA